MLPPTPKLWPTWLSEYRTKKSTTHKLWQIIKFLSWRDDNSRHDETETTQISKKIIRPWMIARIKHLNSLK